MANGSLEYKCKKCNYVNREIGNMWMYGSPIRQCKNCKCEYFDGRWREVALEGVDPKSNNPMFYLKGMAFMAALTSVCGALAMHLSSTTGIVSTRLIACIGVGVIGMLMCFVLAVRAKLGFDEKRNARYMNESIKRLESDAYVNELRSHGYNVSWEQVDRIRKESKAS